ncbi:uncharacterized protein [Vicugna pacos]|uniref:Uncharacterized protein isoform X3 n=1 Tax=Vicugna pacos TaxID=30538 RepID=A0ABM5DI55_VICPA
MLPQPAPTAPVNALVVVRELYVQKRVQCVSQKIPKPCSSVRDCVFACVPLSPLSVHPLTPAPSWDSPQCLAYHCHSLLIEGLKGSRIKACRVPDYRVSLLGLGSVELRKELS